MLRCRPPSTASRESKPTSTGTCTTILRLVGGKGGVGKTTCAAAMAVAAARAGRRTLVVSTDPAPSLGDALGVRLSASPRRVSVGGGTLHALELDARRAFARWLAPRRPELETIALRGTWLDLADITALLDLSLPGLDEVASLLEIVRLVREARADELIVDTAPTGHTLRLLAMPHALGGVARVLDHMQARHREIVHALRGRWSEDAADVLIRRISAEAEAAHALFKHRAACEVMLVTLAEAMSVEETLDAVDALAARGIEVARVVVNRLTLPPPSPCAWCDARRRGESAAARRLQAGLRDRAALATVTAREREPIGPAALAGLATELEGSPRGLRLRASGAGVGAQTATLPPRFDEPWRVPVARLVMFGGKGGVGKTTCAAAAAIGLASSDPNRRVLVVSTDPAHSLGDALGLALSDAPRPVRGAGRLHARELDASGAFDAVRVQYAAAIERLFDRLQRTRRVEVSHDRRVLLDLLALAPPGIDEVAAAIDLVDLLDDPEGYDTIVVDTAPTGHALRLLEMPETLHAWTKALMSILLKYQPLLGLAGMGDALLRLSRGLGRLRERLADPEWTRFVAVTRAAALPMAETRRLLASVRRLGVPVSAVLVNAAGHGTCARCRRASGRERRAVQEWSRRSSRERRSPIVLAPAAVPPPHGLEALARWVRRWSTSEARRPGSRDPGPLGAR